MGIVKKKGILMFYSYPATIASSRTCKQMSSEKKKKSVVGNLNQEQNITLGVTSTPLYIYQTVQNRTWKCEWINKTGNWGHNLWPNDLTTPEKR